EKVQHGDDGWTDGHCEFSFVVILQMFSCSCEEMLSHPLQGRATELDPFGGCFHEQTAQVARNIRTFRTLK
uniref:Uncharacterized protein n=1 Tax=Aegilops tauschii subsp. strangulata TaxID=200361 RepID=A0A453E563_AEGTS